VISILEGKKKRKKKEQKLRKCSICLSPLSLWQGDNDWIVRNRLFIHITLAACYVLGMQVMPH
jgi:hypothetical protein